MLIRYLNIFFCELSVQTSCPLKKLDYLFLNDLYEFFFFFPFNVLDTSPVLNTCILSILTLFFFFLVAF